MKVCPQCGKSNEPLYKFCLGCGGELPDELVGKPHTLKRPDEEAPKAAAPETTSPCPSCEAPVPAGYRFCPACGADQQPRARGGGGRMVLIRPDGSDGGMFPLQDGYNRIGREAGAIFDADGYLSPHHVDLTLTAEGLMVSDAGSLNGTFVRLHGEEELFDGDVFRVGQELLRFDIIPAPQPLEDGTEILGSPNPGYWGRLAIIVGPDEEGSAFPLSGDAIHLGRERGDILFPEDGYVSGAHARVSVRDGISFIEDLGSSNGTYLRLRGEMRLSTGAFLLLGQQLFRIEF